MQTDILNAEAWCAMALLMLAPRELTVEEACNALAKGKLPMKRVDIIAPEMARLRAQDPPVPWAVLAASYGITKDSAYSIVSRWKKSQREAG